MEGKKVIIIMMSIMMALIIAVGAVSTAALVVGIKAIAVASQKADKSDEEEDETDSEDETDDYDYYDDDTDYGETREDDVTIADEYVIRSTKQISDAYLSGDTSSLSDADQETLNLAKAVIDEVITDGMSDFEKEKAIYDWMIQNLEYDDGSLVVVPTTGANVDNPYGVLKNHKAVCVGFATTFRLFMQMMNIPCMVVHNTDCYHSWDLVQLDGNWYHTDIYSDIDSAAYANFNMNDTLASVGHDWDTTFFPAATSLEYNMAYRNAVDADDIYAIPALIRGALDDSTSMLSFKFADTDDTTYSIGSTMLDQIQSMIMSTEEYGYCYLDWNWNYLDDGTSLLVITLNRYDDEDYDDDTTLDEETREKIDSVLDENFGDLTTDDSFYNYLYDSIGGYDTVTDLEGNTIQQISLQSKEFL